jgi:hypothetical protein
VSKLTLLTLPVLGTVLSLAANGHAQSIIKSPGDHPSYVVEIEPHLEVGWANLYRSNGVGAGARFSIPIVKNGFIPSINNSVAISFGLDWLRYSGCYYYNKAFRADGYGCGASYFVFPVAMQWNFWLTPRWSVFGEPGLYVYHGAYDDYCGSVNNARDCGYPTRNGVDFAFYAGGRFHFSDTIAITLRLGYPTVSFGVSFML